MKILYTRRLTIRPFNKEDAPFLMELLNSPEWLRMLGDQQIYSIKDAGNFLKNNILQEYEIHQFGFHLIESKDDKKPIGLCGITLRKGHENPDLGFAVLPAFTEKGYALEASICLLDHIKSNFSFKKIEAFTALSNIRSQHLLEKLNFQMIDEVFHTEFKIWVKHYELNW